MIEMKETDLFEDIELQTPMNTDTSVKDVVMEDAPKWPPVLETVSIVLSLSSVDKFSSSPIDSFLISEGKLILSKRL